MILWAEWVILLPCVVWAEVLEGWGVLWAGTSKMAGKPTRADSYSTFMVLRLRPPTAWQLSSGREELKNKRGKKAT